MCDAPSSVEKDESEGVTGFKEAELRHPANDDELCRLIEAAAASWSSASGSNSILYICGTRRVGASQAPTFKKSVQV